MSRHRTTSMLQKLGLNSVKKSRHQDQDDTSESRMQQKWLHAARDIRDNFVIYHAKYLGSVVVNKPKGVEVVKDAVRKLKIARQVKISEAGNKGSKLQKVEIHVSIEALKVIDAKTRSMICSRPLHRVSYCADDHADKKLFMFIAKDQETKTHSCFVFMCEKEAAELTLTLGQAFQMAYRRYVEKEKQEMKENNKLMTIDKEIEKIKTQNEKLKQENELEEKISSIPNPPEMHNGGNTSMHINGNEKSMLSFLPSTPGFQSIANPFPTSPDIFFSNSSRGVSSDMSFNMSTDKKDDVFDPFGNFNSTQAVTIDTKNDVDVEGISLFPIQMSNQNGDMFNYSTSPKDEDFHTKTDPFADTPDWNSVASEEVMQIPQYNNPFSDFTPSNQAPAPSFNPFGLSAADNTSLDAGQFDDFSTDNSSSDLFSRYMSNVVASRETSGNSNSTNNNFDVFDSSKGTDLNTVIKKDVSFSEKEVNSLNHDRDSGINAFGNSSDTFEVNFENPDSNKFGISFDQLTIKDVNGIVLSDFDETDDSFNFNGSNLFNTSQQELSRSTDSNLNVTPGKTFRPRPSSGIGTKHFGFRAPPTKKEIKASSTMLATPSKLARPSVTSTPQQQEQTEQKFGEKIISSSHILPNVERRISSDNARSLPRTTITRTMQPLKDSISLASKSLDDLASGDSSKPLNPFSNSADSSPHQHSSFRRSVGALDKNGNFDGSLSFS